MSRGREFSVGFDITEPVRGPLTPFYYRGRQLILIPDAHLTPVALRGQIPAPLGFVQYGASTPLGLVQLMLH